MTTSTAAPVLKIEMQQQQTMAPRQQQALHLLQLSSLNFLQELQRTVESNPFLEIEEQEYIEYKAIKQCNVVHNNHSLKNSRTNDDLTATLPEKLSLQNYLFEQLNTLRLPAREKFLTLFVVDALDDDGYLRISINNLQAELVQLCTIENIKPLVHPDELERAIQTVQSLEPIGVGGRTVQECLCLQLINRPSSPVQHLAYTIVKNYFSHLIKHDTGRLAHALSCSQQEIKKAYIYIQHLSPHPGWSYSNLIDVWVTPDIVTNYISNKWIAHLNPQIVPELHINKIYTQLFQQYRQNHHSDNCASLAQQLQEARWVVRNIEQRFQTILRIAQVIVTYQQQFFVDGPLAMQPFSLKDVATKLGLHESTISRATQNKYISTPFGLFGLNYFFSRSLEMQQGGRCSTTAIRNAIKEIIAAEKADARLSDTQITSLLTTSGLQVARRTVAKYRQMMRIPTAMQRC